MSLGVTNPSYVLVEGDTISISIKDEAELAVTQLIDKGGTVRLSLVGDLQLSGKTVRNAETLIGKTYTEQEYLRSPEVRIQVVEYAPRIVTVMGAVRTPGKIAFPRDLQQIDILDAIMQAGGMQQVAKGETVSVFRINPEGREIMFTVDVAKMMSGKRGEMKVPSVFVFPGDRIVVPEKYF